MVRGGRRLEKTSRERCPGCHPERSAGSLCPASQTLRGVYPERSEWAQGDRPSLKCPTGRYKARQAASSMLHFQQNNYVGGPCDLAKPWDDTMKRLIRAYPQHFVSWVLKGAIFKDALSIELKNWTRETDFLLDVIQNEQQMLMHMEFQSREDEDMAQRLLEYNVLATREHGRPVLSCVIYLRKDSGIAESPLKWELPTGQEILRFHFIVIKLWEIAADELIQTGLTGLLPLVPLTKDGGQYETIDEVATKLATAEEYNLLEYARRFASLVFKDGSDREWLNRRFAVYKDILDDSWVVQEERQEGKLEGFQQALLKIVQRRFPEMVDLTKKQIDGVEDPELLEDLLVNISLAQNVQDAIRALFALDKTERRTDTDHDAPTMNDL